MRKETIITLLILTFSSLLSSGQLVWVEENLDNETGLRTGRIKGTFGPIPVFYLIEPKTVLRNLNDGPVSFLGFDLSNTDLNQANLMNARLIRTDLSGANLNQAVLSGADLRTSTLRGADLSVANLQNANLENADLSGADLYAADFNGADLNGAILTGAKLNNTDFSASNLDGVTSGQLIFDDRGGILEPIKLPREWTIINGYLIGPKANLSDAQLSGRNLTELNLSGADLSGADLSGSNLNEVNLQGANLQGANLGETSLAGTNFNGADLSQAIVAGTNFNESSFAGAIGLEDLVLEVPLLLLNAKDERITELEARLADYQNERAGTIVINASNGKAILSLNIEKSDNLKTWQKTDQNITKIIELNDGKKFYRFTLDK